jgi:hypothetical protein
VISLEAVAKPLRYKASRSPQFGRCRQSRRNETVVFSFPVLFVINATVTTA